MQAGTPAHQLRYAGAVSAELTSLDDDALMQLIAKRRRDAFAALVERHHRLVLAMARRFLNDSAAGHDVAQEVFLSMWSRADTYQPQGRFRAYLVTVTLNLCRAQRHHRSLFERIVGVFSSVPSKPPPEPETQVSDQQAHAKIRRAVATLPSPCREVVVLRFTQGLALEEIALQLELPLNTVKSHLHRGLKRLATILPETTEES